RRSGRPGDPVTRSLAMACTALVMIGTALPAQRDTASRRAQRAQGQFPVRGGARAAGRGAVAREAQKDLPRRQMVQQAFRNRVREVLNLDQAKTRRLFQTDQDFNRQRAALNQSERQARVALAAAMQDSGSIDQSKVDQYINQLVQAPRKR